MPRNPKSKPATVLSRQETIAHPGENGIGPREEATGYFVNRKPALAGLAVRCWEAIIAGHSISHCWGRVRDALGGARTHDLSLRRATLYPTELRAHVQEPLMFMTIRCRRGDLNSHARKGHYTLNVARLPFRHFGTLRHSVVGDTGLEPVTSTMSTWRSNQLS